MTRATTAALFLLLPLLAACPGEPVVRPDDGADKPPAKDAQAVSPPEPEVVQRPVFDPDMPSPCESHTACYLNAKEAHETGERAGYLLALERCEYYRGRYQLEKFYGLCLLILADCYRHLNNFEESKNCYRRFLDSQPDDQELALQARSGLEEVEIGEKEPATYRRYLEAVSLLSRHNFEPDGGLLDRARSVLEAIQDENPTWGLTEKVTFLLRQLERLQTQPEKEPREAPPAEPPES